MRERIIDETEAPDRSTGVVSTACGEGSLRKWGRPGAGGGNSTRPQGWRPAWVSERAILVMKPGNAGRAKGPRFGCVSEEGKKAVIGDESGNAG
jgi:hypothetical protein